MDRQAFKQRMQNLKSYRENNPGKGYWDWRNSLPDNLKYTDDTEYDMQAAYEAGVDAEYVEEDRTYHLPTRDPKTGYIFKKSIHPTFWKGLAEDAKLGYDAYFLGDKVYTKSKGEGPIKAFADGGQTGDPEKERFYQATGRSSSGRPLEEGLKPVFSLEDAANMTPIGDAISAKDTYDAVKNRDWLGAGLAALTVLPFVPSGLRNVKAAARYIPTVNRTEQSLINQALGNISKKRDYLSDIANSRNRVLEDINTIPYRNRAEQADKIFGTNYSETYDLLDDLYQHRYFDLPEVQPKDMVASGRLQAKPFAEERFNKTGVGAEPNEFDLWVNTGMYRDPMQLANHEMNHYTDYIISRNIDTSVNNNMLKQLENSLKQTDATDYYRKGTEQKAYMNQLRTILKQNGEIQNLDEPVSSALLKKYLDKMPDSDPIKKMSKQHKNIKTYTKWFNTIPLLGTATLGINTYFNNKENKQ